MSSTKSSVLLQTNHRDHKTLTAATTAQQLHNTRPEINEWESLDAVATVICFEINRLGIINSEGPI